MAEGIGRELKPVKFGIKPGQELDPSPVTKPDKFGQVNNNQKDVTSDAISTLESRRQHFNSDVDANFQAQHHTLGLGRNQASPGNHIHDGVTSPKIGALTVGTSASAPVPAFTLTGSKGGNVALANLITFLKLHFNFNDTTT